VTSEREIKCYNYERVFGNSKICNEYKKHMKNMEVATVQHSSSSRGRWEDKPGLDKSRCYCHTLWTVVNTEFIEIYSTPNVNFNSNTVYVFLLIIFSAVIHYNA